MLHGISRTALAMRPLERALSRAGYATLNLTYPSRRHSLADLADGLAPRVRSFATGLDGPLHIVTHSMGGLVARVLLARHRPERLGRVVMLAPPNAGSEIADLLHRNPLYRGWFGPAGAQLVARRDEALSALLGGVDFELGVIAGTRSALSAGVAAAAAPERRARIGRGNACRGHGGPSGAAGFAPAHRPRR